MRNSRPLDTYVVSYSSRHEDLILDGLFESKQTGQYIDIGPHHPNNDSATRWFYEKGWSGVVFSPSKRVVELFEKNRGRDEVVHAIVADKQGGTVDYTESLGDGALEDYHATQKVQIVSLRDYFGRDYSNEVNLLKVDANGDELAVLKGIEWNTLRPHVICIVLADQGAKIEELLESQRYQKVVGDGKNGYFIDMQYYTDVDVRSLANGLVFGPYVVSAQVYDELKSLHERIDRLRGRLRDAVALKDATSNIDVDSIRFRQMGRLAAKKIDAHIQGKILPEVTFDDIRPITNAVVSGKELPHYDKLVWQSLTDQYMERKMPNRLHPRRILAAVYRRSKKGAKIIIKRGKK